MKRILCSVAGLLLVTAIAQADTIARWTFEAGQNSSLASGFPVTGTSPGNIPSDIGVGFATGSHASATTSWSAPAGDATPATSIYSLSATFWAQTTDYFQFSVSPDLADFTYSGINLTWDQTGSNTGPKTWALYYSATGSSYTQLGSDYTIVNGSWNTTTVAASHESADLSSITALNTANTMYFRLVDDSPVTGGAITGGNVGTAGTDRVDNFTVTAVVTPVPEPQVLSLLGGFGLLALSTIRRRK